MASGPVAQVNERGGKPADPTQLRVLQLIDGFGVGGAQRLLREFASRSAGEGVHTSVIALSEPTRAIPEAAPGAGWDVSFVPSNAPTELMDPLRLRRLRRRVAEAGPFDAIHAHLGVASILGAHVARREEVPLIVTLHNVPPPAPRSVRERVKRTLLHRQLRSAQRLLAVGASVASGWDPLLGQAPITIVPNPVTLVHRSQLVGDSSTVVAVSRFVEVKRIPDVVRAMALVRQKRPEARLILVGDGPCRPEVEQTARELDIVDAVEMVGITSDVGAHLARSGIFVSASSREGLPLSILEAMSCGLSVVATSVGDNLDIVHAAGGVVVAPGDIDALAAGILSFMDDPARRARSAELGPAFVTRHHDPGAWTRRVASIYREVVDEYGRREGLREQCP